MVDKVKWGLDLDFWFNLDPRNRNNKADIKLTIIELDVRMSNAIELTSPRQTASILTNITNCAGEYSIKSTCYRKLVIENVHVIFRFAILIRRADVYSLHVLFYI